MINTQYVAQFPISLSEGSAEDRESLRLLFFQPFKFFHFHLPAF